MRFYRICTVALMVLWTSALWAVPPQAPVPLQAPPVAEEIAVKKVCGLCDCGCSPACTCGCNEGLPCQCGEGTVSRNVSQDADLRGTPSLPPPAAVQYVGYPYGTTAGQNGAYTNYWGYYHSGGRYNSMPYVPTTVPTPAPSTYVVPQWGGSARPVYYPTLRSFAPTGVRGGSC